MTARPSSLFGILSRSALAAACLLLALALRPVAAEEGDFVSEIPDLPLMPGLTELKEAGVVFDKPAGRIVEAFAAGPVERGEVMTFYRATLPQLGWAPAGREVTAEGAEAEAFAREGERLSIEVIEAAAGGEPLTLRFTLRPE